MDITWNRQRGREGHSLNPNSQFSTAHLTEVGNHRRTERAARRATRMNLLRVDGHLERHDRHR